MVVIYLIDKVDNVVHKEIRKHDILFHLVKVVLFVIIHEDNVHFIKNFVNVDLLHGVLDGDVNNGVLEREDKENIKEDYQDREIHDFLISEV